MAALGGGLFSILSCGVQKVTAPATEGPVIAQGVTIIDTIPSFALIDTAAGVYTFAFDGDAPSFDTGAKNAKGMVRLANQAVATGYVDQIHSRRADSPPLCFSFPPSPSTPRTN